MSRRDVTFVPQKWGGGGAAPPTPVHATNIRLW